MTERTQKYVNQLGSRSPIDEQVKRAQEMGVGGYLKWASQQLKKADEKGVGKPEKFFIVNNRVRYPLKAIVRMALLTVDGDAGQNNPPDFFEAAKELGVNVIKDKSATLPNFSGSARKEESLIGSLSDQYYKTISRPEQRKFRKKVLETYGPQCAITGCPIVEALEAAHIISWSTSRDDSTENGIPLRRDIHRLFDLGFVSVSPDSLGVSYDEDLQDHFGPQISGQLKFMKEVPPDILNRLKQKLADRWGS